MTSSPTNARDQQFCLRWNNYQSNLTQVFNQLFQTESFVDVTLACEGHSVKAHRLVLAACSPYFMTVLTETPCTHPVVILQGVKWTELKAIVEFIYKGEINICQEQLASLLRVAESLKIRGLADVGGEEAEAVLTSPSASPRMPSQFWAEDAPRKRRRLSEEPRSRSRSRTPTPGPNTPHTPASGGPPEREVLEPIVDHPGGGTLSRGSSSSTSNPPPSLPSPSPVASLASSLSSLAHLHGPMPPPGPPIPHHLAHLPPLSPLSPLLNMHPMSRHHPPEDFEIRPGIAEMIREEERAQWHGWRRHPLSRPPCAEPKPNPKERCSSSLGKHWCRSEFNEAKLLESTHHWIGNPMADSYQAQVQAAWQKSWNQTQSLLQNLRFRERGPLKSWRPETMADAIHAVLKEGLSLSQSARKYDIPYPTFVLYANRVHNLLGPSHEPGDMRPKGRGRPQRILLGAWPEEQIKGVIRAVVFRDTAVFRDGDHKENKKPATPQIKDEALGVSQSSSNGPFTPNSASRTPNGTPDKSGNSTPIPPSTPSTSQPFIPGNVGVPQSTPPPLLGGPPIPLPSPFSKEPSRISPTAESRTGNSALLPNSSSPPSLSSSAPTSSGGQSLTTSTSSNLSGPHTPQSRPSSVTSNGPINGLQQNGPTSNALSHSPNNNSLANNNITTTTTTTTANMNGMILPGLSSPISTNGGPQLVPNSNPTLNQHTKPPQISSPVQQQLNAQNPTSQHSHLNHQQSPLHSNSQMPQQRNPHFPPHHPNHQHPARHQQNHLGPIAGPQQMLGLIAGGLSPSSLGTPPAHMARLYGEGPPHMHPRPPQPPINAFHPGFPRGAHPGMQPMPLHNPMNSLGARIGMDDHEPSPEAILFGKLASTDRHLFGQHGLDIGRQIASNPFDTVADTSTNTTERSMMFRDVLDTIKSEPEAIMN